MKNNSLLKKIESFYKLAIYSDRASFFKAIAENRIQSNKLPQYLKDIFYGSSNELGNVGKGDGWNSSIDVSAEKKEISDASLNSYSEIDLDKVMQMYNSAIAKVGGARDASEDPDFVIIHSVVKKLEKSRDQLASYMQSMNFASNKSKSSPSEVEKDQVGSAPKDVTSLPLEKPTVAPTTISTDVQNKLDEILTSLAVQGKLFYSPIKPTGKLDAQTKLALESFRKYFALGASTSLKDLLDDVVTMHEMLEKTNMLNK